MKTKTETNPKTKAVMRAFATFVADHGLFGSRLILRDDTQIVIPGDGEVYLYRQETRWSKLPR